MHTLMNISVIYDDICGIFVPNATIKKGGFAGYSISPDFNFYFSVIISYIFDVNSHSSRQSCAVYLSVLYAVFLE